MYDFKTKIEPFARAFLNCESDDKGIKTAAGFRGMCREMNATIDRSTGLCMPRTNMINGQITDSVSGFSYRNPCFCWPWRIPCEDTYSDEEKAELARIRELMEPWTKRNIDVVEGYYTDEHKRMMNSDLFWGGNWIGHANPDFCEIADLGTDALRARIEAGRAANPGRDAFYDSLVITLEGIDDLCARFAALANEMLETERDPKVRARLEAIVRTMDHAPQQPCRDFIEACIMFMIIFVIDGGDSPGHFDQYMYPYWAATKDKALAREYLEAVWVTFHDMRAWNLCISGSDADGNDLTNELSYEILDVTAKYAFQTPNLTMRCHKGTPEKLMRAAYKAIASGCGLPALYNDEAVCPALEALDIPPEDAHRYVMNGCNQIDIQGRSHMGLEDGEVLFPAALEYALFNGVEYKRNTDFGLKTGDPSGFATFDEFYAAFIRQLDHLTDLSVEMANEGQEAFAKNAPNPLRSILIDGCVEKGRWYSDGGPVYNNGQILAEGIADCADSLANIKKFVYEDKKYTMTELVDALKNDFEGRGDMWLELKNSGLNFGNDNDYVDSIAKATVDHFNEYLTHKRTYRGGRYSGGCSPYNRAYGYGKALGALPNGKRAGETLIADSIGSTPGLDVNGPTALMNSCLKFDHRLPGSGFILNVKFDKSLFLTRDGEESFIALVRAYFGRLGQMLTFTVVSPDELLDAQQRPECHRDLIVRVGGYSDYFVDLEKGLQDNVIARTYN